MNHRAFPLLLLAAYLLLPAPDASATIVGEQATADTLQQAARFLSFRDPAVRYAVIGSLLLGLSCGILGSFIVVRKLSLMGDTLSHAVLPGVALGFLWSMSKDPVAIFIGASAAGLLGTFVVKWIRDTTKLKEDAALGIVLASFFSIGVVLMSRIQKLPTSEKSGLDKLLYGQAAGLGADDIQLMAGVTLLALILVVAFYKELLATSFDPGFSRAAGLPASWVHHGLMLLLSFSVVVALQAVGVVLVSAMLITPAATAYLLTDRMHRLLIIAACAGMASGFAGCFFSFFGNNLPTGPFMVLGASGLFFAAFLFGPRHGVVTRGWRQFSRSARVERENTLKAIFRILEQNQFTSQSVTIKELALMRHETLEESLRRMKALRDHGLLTLNDSPDAATLTPLGWRRACEIVRNHRLWELYLTHEANYAADHVHEDAEQIEHILGEDTVRMLDKQLNHPMLDPHGSSIPSIERVHAEDPDIRSTQSIGYGRKE